VVQGEKYKKPNDWSSDDNKIEVPPKVTAPRATNENKEKDKQNKDDKTFFKVPNRNNRKRSAKKQKKIDATKSNAERMERANKLLQTMGYKRDHEDGKAGTDHNAKKSRYNKEKLMPTHKKWPKKRRRIKSTRKPRT
jgi:hypothetical protein